MLYYKDEKFIYVKRKNTANVAFYLKNNNFWNIQKWTPIQGYFLYREKKMSKVEGANRKKGSYCKYKKKAKLLQIETAVHPHTVYKKGKND